MFLKMSIVLATSYMIAHERSLADQYYYNTLLNQEERICRKTSPYKLVKMLKIMDTWTVP